MSSRIEDAIVQMEESAAPRFILVCVLLLALLCIVMLVPETSGGKSLMTLVAGIVTIAAVWAARVQTKRTRRMIVVVIAAMLFGIVAELVDHEGSSTANTVVLCVFTMGMPLAIIAGLRDERKVNIQTVFGAISLYLMLGLFFAFLITLVTRLTDAPYFAQHTDGNLSQRVYFSYVTLGTLGYGDYTPALAIGRLLAVIETVLGSLYLVTAVSLVVSRLGYTRNTAADQTVSTSPD
jgi:Ion channel